MALYRRCKRAEVALVGVDDSKGGLRNLTIEITDFVRWHAPSVPPGPGGTFPLSFASEFNLVLLRSLRSQSRHRSATIQAEPRGGPKRESNLLAKDSYRAVLPVAPRLYDMRGAQR